MKKLLSFLIILSISLTAYGLPDIIAVVNNKPITSYDFLERKKMIRAVNNIEDNNPQIEKQITGLALKSLIDEQVLFDHAANIKGKISEKEIDNAIKEIERKNDMHEGHVVEFLKSKNVSVKSFRSQIKSEIIKMNIMSQFSRSVNVSQREIDALVANDNQREIDVEAVAFVSKDKSGFTFSKMKTLQKNIKSCDNIKLNSYDKFASKQIYNQSINEFAPELQAILKDMPIGKPSKVLKSDEGFKVVVLCKKNIKYLKENENELAVNFLTDRKISQKAKEFLYNLHKKANIKIFI